MKTIKKYQNSGKPLKPGQRLTESGKVVSGKEARRVTDLEKGMASQLMKKGPLKDSIAPKKKMDNGGTMKSRSRTVERNPEGTHKMVTKSKITPRGESSSMKEKRTLKGVMKGAPKRTTGREPVNFDIPSLTKLTPTAKGGKQMMKRADGSVSPRGLWDNLRAAKGSGKKPTAAMLKQEKKIKAKGK